MKFLIVADQTSVAMIVAFLLHRAGCGVETARDAGRIGEEDRRCGLEPGAVDYRPFDTLNFASRLLAQVNRQSEFA